ncbi:radical SAM protein [Allochromatium humboldtianum]|uniref:Radical SAM protein n=1 Tax=Allochromatium humboldtianum TaxID=504901 RepID=A0A850RP28_9GAMM|nr:radical SAM/SPASM domain-containing protein [Allochromatium humboldtianum]NVZ11211.1 radical SAM protein [Allochromatium humboldtianum]
MNDNCDFNFTPIPRINLKNRTQLETVIPLSTPYILTVSPSSACNLQCLYCPTGYTNLIKSTSRHIGVMKMSIFEKILEQALNFPNSIKILMLVNDGEPLLNKNLPEMVKLAKKTGKFEKIETTTNAFFLSEEKGKKLVENGLNKLNVSLYGLSSKSYKNFTKKNINFLTILNNIKKFSLYRSECELAVKIPKELISNEFKENSFYEIFASLADKVFIENTAEMWPNFSVSKKMKIQIQNGMWRQKIKKERKNICPNIFYALTVNSNGVVSACYVDWARKLTIGNVLDSNLVDLWQSDFMHKLRLQHLSKNRWKNPICQSCFQPDHCALDDLDEHAENLFLKYKKYYGL